MRPQRLLESTLSYQREQAHYRSQQERKRRTAAYARKQREEAEAARKRQNEEQQRVQAILLSCVEKHDNNEFTLTVIQQTDSDQNQGDSYEDYLVWKREQKGKF